MKVRCLSFIFLALTTTVSALSGNEHTRDMPEQEITLIPFGGTTLRISQFPVVR